MTRAGSTCPCGRYNPAFADVCYGCGGEGPRARWTRLQVEGEALVLPLLRHFAGQYGDVSKTVQRMRDHSRAHRGPRAGDDVARMAHRAREAERKRRARELGA